jgi:hypothetical protein
MTFGRIAVCLALWLPPLIGCVRPETRRAHARNIAKAEALKREFDKDVLAGTSLAAVEDYLRSKGLQIGSELGRDGTGSVLVELVQEESTSWYCGKGSVGLMVYFTANKLDKAFVESWSFNCP